MPRVGYETMIQVFEWENTFDALDRAAIVIGERQLETSKFVIKTPFRAPPPYA
jgi:hypothetical protein